jgi:FHS family Na+ dependent glucose MFS transporter 1
VFVDRTVMASTAVYFASYILIGALGGAVGPTLGPFATQVGVGLSTIGIILTTRSLGYLAGALTSSRWMDRIRIHRGLAAAALLAGAVLALLPWARSLGLLMVLVVPLGFATAGLDVGVSTMLLRAYRDRAAPFVSALHFFYGAGGLAAPFLVAAFAAGRETSIYPLLTVGFALLAIALFVIPESARPNAAKVSVSGGGAESAPATRAVAPSRGFAVATSVILLYVGAEIGFASWLYEFVHLQFAAATATTVTGAFWAAFSVSRLGAVLAARRFSSERILAAAFSGGLAFTLVLVFSPRALAAVWIGAVGVGAAVGPIYPNVITAYSRRYELTGRRFGAIAVASCTGSMVFPWLIGRLLDVGGTIVVPGVTAGLLLAASGAAWVFFGRQRGSAANETV